jgi:plastocyanin
MTISRTIGLWCTIAALVASCGGSSSALVVDDTSATVDYDFYIPTGTGDEIRAGADITILPAELDVHVGETIRITNDDDEGHYVGIFFVGAHEQVTQRFASPGEFVGNCTVHPSGTISLVVSE